MVRRLAATVVTGLCVAVGVAAPADARFVINESMEGVELGMTTAEVRARLGAPTRRDAGPDFVSWRYRRPPLEVALKPEVVTLHTRSEDIRGPRGIGVGTREPRLKAVVGRRLRCETTAGQRLCVYGSFETGERSTVFEMERRRVAAVTISVSVR